LARSIKTYAFISFFIIVQFKQIEYFLEIHLNRKSGFQIDKSIFINRTLPEILQEIVKLLRVFLMLRIDECGAFFRASQESRVTV
jgi:hypothetical protein